MHTQLLDDWSEMDDGHTRFIRVLAINSTNFEWENTEIRYRTIVDAGEISVVYMRAMGSEGEESYKTMKIVIKLS